MIKTHYKFLILCLSLVLCTITPTQAQAHMSQQSGIIVDHPVAPASLGNVQNGAAFFSILNSTDQDIKLISTQSDIAEKTELHEHIHEGDVVKMREVIGGIAIKAGETVHLRPGGYHIMFLGLKEQLTKGMSFPVLLTFDNGTTLNITIEVESAKALHEKYKSSQNMTHHKEKESQKQEGD